MRHDGVRPLRAAPWRYALRVTLMCGLAGVVAAASRAPRQDVAERRNDLIVVEVAVERSRGGLVSGLGREDFEVLSDFEPCPIERFEAGGPLTIALVVDTSPSMPLRGDDLREAVERGFIPDLKPADRVRVGRIGGPLLPARFTADRRELVDAIGAALAPDDTIRFGPSPIWDAADGAIVALEHEAGRRAVVLVTDGRATGNVRSRADVAVRAMATGGVVSAVGLAQVWTWGVGAPYDWRGLGTTTVRSDPGRALRELTGVTGGGFAAPWPVSSAGEVRTALARTVQDLRQMYTLEFVAPVLDGRVHRLEVRVKDPGMTVRGRRAYLAEARR